jgi:hypothetical protein
MPRRPMLHLLAFYHRNCYFCSPSIHTKNSIVIQDSFLSMRGITQLSDAFILGLMDDVAEC